MIDRMSAPDAYTVVFELKYPYGGFADILAQLPGANPDADKM